MSADERTRWAKGLFIVFLLVWAVNEVLLCLGICSAEETGWAEGALVVSAALSSLATLARRLPIQNVLMAGVLIGALGSVVTGIGAATGIPFGPFSYGEACGEQIFGVLPWPIPFLWITVLVSGRGVARLIMRPWRKTTYYGFWVIGLTAALGIVLDLSLEPLAATVKHYWSWRAPAWVWGWYSAPWANFAGWFVTAVLVLAFTTPWLINKQPVKRPMDYQPLVLWLLLNAWLITGNALQHLWPATVAGIAGNLLVAGLTLRGALWNNKAREDEAPGLE